MDQGSGVAWSPGKDLVFAYDVFGPMGPSPVHEASTVMHEFGHNLGLNHGGTGGYDSQGYANYKPNYMSIMNYLYQLSGLYRDGSTGVVDFSSSGLADLNENAVREDLGLDPDSEANRYQVKFRDTGGTVRGPFAAATNVDWNNNGSVTNTPYALKLSLQEWGTTARRTLSDHNDWTALIFGAGGMIGPGASVAGAPMAITIDEAEVDELHAAAAEVVTLEIDAPRVVTASGTDPAPVTFTLENPRDASREYSLALEAGEGLRVTGLPERVTVPARASVQVTAQVTAQNAEQTTENAQRSRANEVAVLNNAQAAPGAVPSHDLATLALTATTTEPNNQQDVVRAVVTVYTGGGTAPEPVVLPSTPNSGAPSVSPPAPGPSVDGPSADSPTAKPGPKGVVPSAKRLAGADRYATAVEASRQTFAGPVEAVYVASGRTFPDALAAAPLAAKAGGPVLLLPQSGVPADVAAEIRRLAPKRIVVFGGGSAVSPQQEAALRGFTDGDVSRVSGGNRYETAVLGSRAWQQSPVVYLATGEGYADALAAGHAAAAADAPLLLTASRTLTPVTAARLVELRPSRIVLVGGRAAVGAQVEQALRHALPNASVERVAGGDRYETAAKVLEVAGSLVRSRVVFAGGRDFADALAAGPVAAARGAALIITSPTCVPASVRARLDTMTMSDAFVVGGDSAIGPGALGRGCGR